MNKQTLLACLTVCLASMVPLVQAQEAKPAAGPAASQAKATQVAPPPKFDVRLPQAGKTLVLPKGKPVSITGLTTKSGSPVKEDSVVTLRWDDRGLEITFDNTDSAIAAQFATTRDSEKFWKDDSLEVFLDIGHRHDTRTAASQPIEIALSVAGGLLDARGRDVGYNITGLEGQVTRREKGWLARIHIPWQGLGAPPALNEVWGLNLGRIDHEGKVYANSKHMSWSPYAGDDFKDINEWGHVIFTDAEANADSAGVKATLAAISAKHAEMSEATIFP